MIETEHNIHDVKDEVDVPSEIEEPQDVKDEVVKSSEVKIILDYSARSHVLIGDFKDKYEKFRVEVLRPTVGYHYHSRMKIGKGWTIRKDLFDNMKNSLKEYNIHFEVV